MTTPVLAPLEFTPPLANPSSQGLVPAVNWVENPGPTRFLADGVRIRPVNYGGEESVGMWGMDWCTDEGSPGRDASFKTGNRPGIPEPFRPWTLWAFDESQCGDPSLGARAEVEQRVQQNFRLQEPIVIEYLFGVELAMAVNADPDIAVTKDTFREAVAYLEGELAKTNTIGMIHASAEAASLEWGIVLPSGAGLRTPLGHQWIFGGGYVDTLGDLVVATSPVYGWRDTVTVRTSLTPKDNTYTAIAERSVVLGYERIVGAVFTNVEGS